MPIRYVKVSITFVLALLLSTQLNNLPMTVTADPGTTVQLAPSASTVDIGTTFVINLTITSVTNLAVWEFRLFWNAILNCASAAEGPFLEKDGSSAFFTFATYNTYNSTHGCLLLGASLMGPVPGVDGSGTLATITFKAIRGGDTQIHFDSDPTWSFLKDSTPPPRNPIPYTTVDGTVHVAGLGPDIAITGISVAKNIVCQGFSVNISVTSFNEGGSAETFNITVYADADIIATRAITLNIGSTEITTILWSTASFPMGSHVIWAYAQPIAGETQVADNNFTDGSVAVTMIGDIAPNGRVDIVDVVTVALCFGASIGDAVWNANADINNDGIINIIDIVVVALHFGETSLNPLFLLFHALDLNPFGF